jgi:predicted nucleic acid-binding Zn ribbon protein
MFMAGKFCVVCNKPIKNPHRQKTCGSKCLELFKWLNEVDKEREDQIQEYGIVKKLFT